MIPFSQSEIDLISAVANDRRFKLNKDDFIYSETYKDKLKCFLKCYRFLENLKVSLVDNDNAKVIIDKMNIILKDYFNIFKVGDYLINSLSKSSSFNNLGIEWKIKLLVSENVISINLLIDTIFPIGRVIRSYDPDEAAGIT
jgi:hypothetical protein